MAWRANPVGLYRSMKRRNPPSLHSHDQRREVLLRPWQLGLLGAGLGTALLLLLPGPGGGEEHAAPLGAPEGRCEDAPIGSVGPPRRERGRLPPRPCAPRRARRP